MDGVLSNSTRSHLTDASLKTLYKAIPVYLAGLTFTKLSILLQYIRLFQGQTIRRIIIGMMTFVAAYGQFFAF